MISSSLVTPSRERKECVALMKLAIVSVASSQQSTYIFSKSAFCSQSMSQEILDNLQFRFWQDDRPVSHSQTYGLRSSPSSSFSRSDSGSFSSPINKCRCSSSMAGSRNKGATTRECG